MIVNTAFEDHCQKTIGRPLSCIDLKIVSMNVHLSYQVIIFEFIYKHYNHGQIKVINFQRNKMEIAQAFKQR